MSGKKQTEKDLGTTYQLLPDTGDLAFHDEFPSGSQGRRTKRSTENLYQTLFFLLLAVYILSAILLVYHIKGPKSNLLRSQGLLPKIPIRVVTFREDKKYDVDPFGSKINPWDYLIPIGRGHIRVKKPGMWNLSGGYPVSEDDISEGEGYSISVFHQLHCLAAIKSKFERSSKPPHTLHGHGKPTEKSHHHSHHERSSPHEHINHCFEYLRQAIMCAGDTALEKAVVVDGKVWRDVDGWGVQHECRDFEMIYNFAADHHAHNETGVV